VTYVIVNTVLIGGNKDDDDDDNDDDNNNPNTYNVRRDSRVTFTSICTATKCTSRRTF
jgi:hypothetical protein